MTYPGGEWVPAPIPDEPGRRAWVPAEQPPSPDGRPGVWRVIPDPADGPSSWEWVPAPALPAPPPPVARRNRRRASRAVAGVVVALLTLVGGVALARSGADRGDPPVDDAALARAAVSESGCSGARTQPAQEPANISYRCRGFDLYVYNAVHERDLWVAGWQRLGRTVAETGAHWIALRPQG